jgi:hypothetical protein
MEKENILFEQNENKQEKMIINKTSDLLKIPLYILNNSKIQNFSGIYFEEIYQEAIKDEILSETDDSSQNKKINKSPKKESNSNQTLKNMNSLNNLIDKKIYSGEEEIALTLNQIKKIKFNIQYNTNFGEEVAILGSIPLLGFWKLEGKFKLKWNEGNIWTGEIDMNKDNMKYFEFKFVIIEKNNIKLWENGNNNIFGYEDIIKNVQKNRIGKYDKYTYEYDKNEKLLILKCNWI